LRTRSAIGFEGFAMVLMGDPFVVMMFCFVVLTKITYKKKRCARLHFNL
jgi:hypothetical protein